MTGWRIGYAAAPLRVAKAMGCLQDQVTSNPTSFAQAGAIAALELPAEAVEAMRSEFQARRDLVLRLLGQDKRIQTAKPQGAFYVFPDVCSYLGGQVADDVALADYLLERVGVATVPGSVFEGPGHLRISYAASRGDLECGIGRILEALSRLS
jgi:aspartate aminotransferase